MYLYDESADENFVSKLAEKVRFGSLIDWKVTARN
jgi:hypothetical protein